MKIKNLAMCDSGTEDGTLDHIYILNVHLILTAHLYIPYLQKLPLLTNLSSLPCSPSRDVLSVLDYYINDNHCMCICFVMSLLQITFQIVHLLANIFVVIFSILVIYNYHSLLLDIGNITLAVVVI